MRDSVDVDGRRRGGRRRNDSVRRRVVRRRRRNIAADGSGRVRVGGRGEREVLL